MGMLGIEFAPLDVPWQRRVQTAAAFFWISVPLIFPIISWGIFGYVMIYTKYYYIPLVYLVFYYVDYDCPHEGGRLIEFVRNFRCWKYLADYFPLSTVKTCELPPDRNYLFCFYPHGVLSANAMTHFSSNGSDFHEKYPGLKTYFATLDFHFRTPFLRDFILALGFVSSSVRSLVSLLSSKEKGVAVALMLGGAHEALFAKPGSYKIVLKNRKGFIKVGLRTGATLVPAFGFGENDLYDQVSNPPGSFLFNFQEFVKKKTGLAPVIPIGRGLFQYSFGIIPRRRPVTTVFGGPIHLPVEKEPTEKSIEEFHKLFSEKLIALFEEHKHKYVENSEDVHLEIH